MKFFVMINRIRKSAISMQCIVIMMFILVCSSCKKQEEVLGYQIPDDSYFVSINNDKGLIYSNGKCTKYVISKDSSGPELSLAIEDSIIYTQENFSKFIEDNSNFIQKATINLFLYDRDPAIFFDLQVIARQLNIYKNTRFSNINQIVGFYESISNQGKTVIEDGKYRTTYEYADSVCEIVKVENIVTNDVLYSDPLILFDCNSEVKPVVIRPNEVESQLIKSAFLIKGSHYLLLSKLYFGCWEYQSGNNSLQELLSPFSTIPMEFQLGKIDCLSSSLIFGDSSKINDKTNSINNTILFWGMVEVPLIGLVDNTFMSKSGHEYTDYDVMQVDEFNYTQFLRVLIDADSHITVLNESNQKIDLVDLLDIDSQYEIVRETLIIDSDFFKKSVLVILGVIVLLMIFIFTDKSIKHIFKVLIIKTSNDKQIRIYRLIYFILYGILLILYIGLASFLWINLIGMQTFAVGIVFILFDYIAITYFPVYFRSKVPSEPFALFLRGFKKDNYNPSYLWNQNLTFELELTQRVRSIRKDFYAIGMTKELFSPKGAKRIYAKDSDWKEIVTQLIQKSSLIIIDFHESESCIFEINRCHEFKSKTICIVRDFKSYACLVQSIDMDFPVIPDDGNNYFFTMGENKIYPYQDSEKFLIALKECVK